jgi:hypothetical protein
MSDSTVVSLRRPDAIDDPPTAVLRSVARRLLAQAIEAEADAFLATMKSMLRPDGRDRLVRHGHGPEREARVLRCSSHQEAYATRRPDCCSCCITTPRSKRTLRDANDAATISRLRASGQDRLCRFTLKFLSVPELMDTSHRLT